MIYQNFIKLNLSLANVLIEVLKNLINSRARVKAFDLVAMYQARKEFYEK